MSRKPCHTTTENRADDVGHDVPDTKVVSILSAVADFLTYTHKKGHDKRNYRGRPLVVGRNVGDECAEEYGDTEHHENVQEFILPLTVFTYWHNAKN